MYNQCDSSVVTPTDSELKPEESTWTLIKLIRASFLFSFCRKKKVKQK